MARVLTVSRVTVRPGCEDAYLQTVHALAALCRSRGQRLWVFRSTSDPAGFLEFSESPTHASHRSRASRTDYELKLERKLRELATYAPDAWDLWEEVPAPAGAEPGEGGGAHDDLADE